MLNLNNAEIKFALDAVRQASLLVGRVQAALVSPALTKDDKSPVTVADFAAQALIGRMLAEAFPVDPLVGEEDSTALRRPEGRETLETVARFVAGFTSGASPEQVCAWIDHGRVDSARRFWTLDPIDGTKGFLRGEQYAVALALVVDGQVQVGVLGCPNLTEGYRPDLEGEGSLAAAARGQGAWVTSLTARGEFAPLRASRRDDPAAARLMRSVESGHTNADQIDDFARELGIQASPVRMDSQAKYAVLASGKADLLLRLLSASRPDYKEKIWDQAAGSLVLEEAGGRISDLHGRPLDFTTGRSLKNNRGLLASNGLLHPAALRALSAIHA